MINEIKTIKTFWRRKNNWYGKYKAKSGKNNER